MDPRCKYELFSGCSLSDTEKDARSMVCYQLEIVNHLFKHKKNVADKDTEIHESEWVNVIPWLCIYAKTIVTAIGYWYILSFLMKHFSL